MLELQNVHVNYGAAPALWAVSMKIEPKELVCVIGPNGAGKTTLINAIMGLNRTRVGKILWQGEDLTGLAAQENLLLGAVHAKARSKRADTLEWVCELFPVVKTKLKQVSAELSGGQQQMVAIGRALMALPQLLLLDEPSLGLAPAIVSEMFNVIQSIHERGTSVLLVEQNVSRALAVSERTYVLENGRVVSSGASNEIASQPEIKKAYLGL